MKGRMVMDSLMQNKFLQHQLWINSAGKNGQKLFLEDIVVKNKQLCNMDISDSVIVGCKFVKTKMTHIECPSSNLCSSSFSFAALFECNAIKAELRYSQFACTTLTNCNFSKADFSESVFTECRILKCKFANTLLSECVFENVEFDQVDFSGSYIDNVTFGLNVDFHNVTGLSLAQIKSIQIRRPESVIQGKEAISWLLNQEAR